MKMIFRFLKDIKVVLLTVKVLSYNYSYHMYKPLGDRIRKFRQLKDIKQFDIAKHLGISESGYGKIERGETTLTIDRLKEISKYIDVSLADLLETSIYYDCKNVNHSPVALHNSSLHFTENENLLRILNMLPSLIEKQTILMDSLKIIPDK